LTRLTLELIAHLARRPHNFTRRARAPFDILKETENKGKVCRGVSRNYRYASMVIQVKRLGNLTALLRSHDTAREHRLLSDDGICRDDRADSG
jgi:hypothetical protein